MVAGAGGERVASDGAAHRSRRSPNDARSFVVGRVGVNLAARSQRALRPSTREGLAIAPRIEAREEFAVRADRGVDEFPRRRCEDRLALLAVGVEQIGPRPTSEGGGKLPGEVHRILKAGVDAIAA